MLVPAAETRLNGSLLIWVSTAAHVPGVASGPGDVSANGESVPAPSTHNMIAEAATTYKTDPQDQFLLVRQDKMRNGTEKTTAVRIFATLADRIRTRISARSGAPILSAPLHRRATPDYSRIRV